MGDSVSTTVGSINVMFGSSRSVRVVNTSVYNLPEYKTKGSSGMDLYASISEEITLKPLQRVLVPTGISLEIPEEYEAQVRPRSGLALKNGLTVLNTPGTIDSDYRGEIGVILVNLSDSEQLIVPGMRVAQLVFMKVEKVSLVEVTTLDSTDRGSGGFGSTGIK